MSFSQTRFIKLSFSDLKCIYKKDLSFKWCYLLNDFSAFIFHSNVHLLSSTFWHMLIYIYICLVCTFLNMLPPPPLPTPLILSAVCKHLELIWDGVQEISFIIIQYWFISNKAYTQVMWLRVPEIGQWQYCLQDKEGLWIQDSAQGAHTDKILDIPLMAMIQHRPSTLKLLPCRHANWTRFVALSVKLKKSRRK